MLGVLDRDLTGRQPPGASHGFNQDSVYRPTINTTNTTTMPATVPATLSIKTLLEINAALSSLEGTPTIVKGDTPESEKVITVPYQFSGKVRWNLVKNAAFAKRISEDFSATRDKIINDVSGGTGRIEPENEAAIKTMNDKIAEVFATEEDTKGLLALPLEGLNLDANQIPLAVLAALEPIISE